MTVVTSEMTSRALPFFAVLVGVIGHTTANGQAAGTQPAGSELDFSGVYVNYTEPLKLGRL